ncbi:hypothetical protein 162275994 [Organic Lake phycodnavirus 2]|jgi:hypothetical protein|nr:hypothetical protein 162275994 [Organic Lake phycodnavirus 2]
MKYLLLLLCIVLLNGIFYYEGYYSKNVRVNSKIPDVSRVNDIGLTKNTLVNNENLVNDYIFKKQLSGIYLNNIRLFY